MKNLFDTGKISVDDSYSYSSGHECFNSHPPYKLPGTEFVIYGGSCSRPVIKDAAVYIGFDQSMRFSGRAAPWNEVREFLYPIPDMGIPSKPDAFTAMVNWTWEQLKAGKKVHCGCIGGHGRTGTFLAALCTVATGEKDSITHVRANYCKKAVESKAQIDFLVQHFGITPVHANKNDHVSSGKAKFYPSHKSAQSSKPVPIHKGGFAPVHISFMRGSSFWK